MKASISSIWLIGLVITFLLIFSAYIIITVDYSATFNMKNDVLSIIEKNKGLTLSSGVMVDSVIKSGERVRSSIGSLRTINAYLSASGYKATGYCGKSKNSEKWVGIKSLDYEELSESALLDRNVSDGKYYYCVARFGTGRSAGEGYESVYYQVQLFYKFEIPVLNQLLPVRVDGTTDEVYIPSSSDLLDGYENSDLYG